MPLSKKRPASATLRQVVMQECTRPDSLKLRWRVANPKAGGKKWACLSADELRLIRQRVARRILAQEEWREWEQRRAAENIDMLGDECGFAF